jgi:hypothetical protein
LYNFWLDPETLADDYDTNGDEQRAGGAEIIILGFFTIFFFGIS